MVENVDAVFEADPSHQGSAESEVEEAFIGYRKEDERGRESQEYDEKAVEVMIVGFNPVREWKTERSDEHKPSSDLITQRQALLCLQRGYTRPSD